MRTHLPIRRSAPRSRRGRPWFALGAAAGAAAEYLLDPDAGHRRRRLAVDRTAATLRRSGRQLMRATRATALQAVGRSKGKLYRLNPPAETLLDDAGLAHKVESVLFRNPNVPKGKISVNAESGTVYLRGQLENADLIDAVVESARAIPGVGEVVSLLHLPGTEAPHPPPAHRPAHTGS